MIDSSLILSVALAACEASASLSRWMVICLSFAVKAITLTLSSFGGDSELLLFSVVDDSVDFLVVKLSMCSLILLTVQPSESTRSVKALESSPAFLGLALSQ